MITNILIVSFLVIYLGVAIYFMNRFDKAIEDDIYEYTYRTSISSLIILLGLSWIFWIPVVYIHSLFKKK